MKFSFVLKYIRGINGLCQGSQVKTKEKSYSWVGEITLLSLALKISFPEKATKICVILVNVKTMRKITQFFLAFSEKLNFTFLLSSFFGTVLTVYYIKFSVEVPPSRMEIPLLRT